MINLDIIQSYYPPFLHDQKRHLLREYLQCQILDFVYSHKIGRKMIFIGGTSLRLVYDNQRFSEDLDFDNFGLTNQEFENLINDLEKYLKKNGYEVEMRIVYKGTYHCHVKLPNILFENNLSTMKTEKIIIKIDTFQQGYDFVPDVREINRFGFSYPINVASINLILSHKISALFGRCKGRDIFDIIFVLGITKKPDRGYLLQKFDIKDSEGLKKRILERIKDFDFKQLQSDVVPFVFQENDTRILRFVDIIKQTKFLED